MSNPTLSVSTSKIACAPAQIPSPSQSQNGSSLASESHTQRRVGGSGSFGAGSAIRSNPSAARNSQSLRKPHKGQRRPRLADEDAAAESAAMQSTNSRKGRTSITHLMNFTLPPRPQYQPQNHLGRNTRRNPTWGLGSGYHAADKARYIHANYRFIVNPNGNYQSQATDADVHLDWSTVLQILVSSQSQSTNCPICLSEPVAPRMAKCGHIFCLPCLIRYMHSTDDTHPAPEKKARWKKCPICWDSIYISETRPVRWFTGQEGDRPQEGGDVVLRLIMRQPGSTLALPRDGAEPPEKPDFIPWYFAAEVMDYAHIMKGSEDYMLEQHESEIQQLLRQEREDEVMFGEETQWTRKAVASIHEAKEKVKGIGNPPSAPKQPGERKPRRLPVEFHSSSDDVPTFYDVQHATKSGMSLPRKLHVHTNDRSETSIDSPRRAPPDTSAEESTITPATEADDSSKQGPQSAIPIQSCSTLPSRLGDRSKSTPQSSRPESPFFFYEALLHFYLSPLDIRILKAAFGSYASFPSTVLPRVERVSTGHIVDDELRRRAKYLAHLPHGCEVGFLECNWTDVVVPEVLDGFANDIERRRKKNQEKEVREEKERLRAEKEEDDKRWAAARRKRSSISQDVISDADFHPLPETSTTEYTSIASSPPWPSSRSHQQGSAFASLASPSTSPSTAKTVWGTRVVVPSSPPSVPAVSHEKEPSENDGWLQGWEQDLFLEEDLVAQLESSSLGADASNFGTAGAQGKKKKGKKITLMTTNARRGA